MRGFLIAFEGLDRTGKSTQTHWLKDHLLRKGRKAEIIKFPDRTTLFGQQIDSFLTNKKKYDDKMLHLLFSINRWELKDKIIGLLESGVDIIMDRYSYSGIAYTHAKGVDFNFC